jgi:hypothetical protein
VFGVSFDPHIFRNLKCFPKQYFYHKWSRLPICTCTFDTTLKVNGRYRCNLNKDTKILNRQSEKIYGCT